MQRWSGSIEAGLTVIRPEDLEFPNTMTDIDYDTWMLSGSAVMRDGQTASLTEKTVVLFYLIHMFCYNIT